MVSGFDTSTAGEKTLVVTYEEKTIEVPYTVTAVVATNIAIKNEFGCKVRSIELNLPQRCASHLASKTDIEESVRVGRAAVKAASDGITRQMMTIERVSTVPYVTEISHRDVSEIANKVKHVNDEYINERGNSITDECAHYLLPLIQGELDVKYENGIPKHIII